MSLRDSPSLLFGVVQRRLDRGADVARYLVAEAFCSHALVSAADAPTQPVSSMPRNEFVYH